MRPIYPDLHPGAGGGTGDNVENSTQVDTATWAPCRR